MTDAGRRRVLAALAGGAATALAGCSALDDGSEPGTSPDAGTGESPTGGNEPASQRDWPTAGRTPRNRLFVADGATASGDLETAWTGGYEVAEETEWATLNHSRPVVADGVV